MNKQEIKRTAQTALKANYGFAPALSDITLLEASGEENRATYILFEVRGVEYMFNSYISHFGDSVTVWCGKGTITKIEE